MEECTECSNDKKSQELMSQEELITVFIQSRFFNLGMCQIDCSFPELYSRVSQLANIINNGKKSFVKNGMISKKIPLKLLQNWGMKMISSMSHW